jgi:hypothetical protein
MNFWTRAALAGALSAAPAAGIAQDAAQHQHHPQPTVPAGWHLMQDGVAFFTLNDQGGPRGGRDYNVQNWWMGMARRPLGGGALQFNVMLSLEPATTGKDGYREILQAGETLNGLPLIDRQHPHEFLMQAAAVWRRPLPGGSALTLAAAPVGEPALGPVAFMHRASAAENPTAALAHHTLDSTHIAMGVLTAALDRGPFQIETSIFNGREPDENRWDLMDPGALDSWSVRGWYRPAATWSFQVSHARLREPEALEPGTVRRTTASASWTTRSSAATLIFGRNDKETADYNAVLAEATHALGPASLYGRYEAVDVETDLLRFGSHDTGKLKRPPSLLRSAGTTGHVIDDLNRIDAVQALTLGALLNVGRWGGWTLGAGGDVTGYRVPAALQPTHGRRPVSFHLFLRLRPPATAGRMINMTMTSGH